MAKNMRASAASPIVNATNLLAQGRLRVEQVHIEALDADIFVRQLSGNEFWKFARLGNVGDSEAKYTPRDSCIAIALSICDADGVRVFTDEDTAADKLVDSWTFQQINEVFQAAAQINGLTEDTN